MTTGLHVTHSFVSAKADGTDNTLVKPSNWNADHQIVMDSGYIVGNQSGSNGPAQQIALTTFIAALLGAPDFPTLNSLGFSFPTTGDAKLTLKTAADAGWVLMDDGTIGDAASGASNRANTDTQNLFELIYNNLSDTNAPLLTSAGAATTRSAQGTAATAFSANCRITLPRQLGRTFIAAGAAGAGLTARTLGSFVGEENHALVTAEEAPHTHGVSVTSSGSANTGIESVTHYHGFSGTTAGMNSNDPHSHSYNQPAVAQAGTPNTSIYGTYSAGTTGSTSINHTHSFSGNTGTESANHYHSVSVSVSGTATTDNGTGTGAGHNTMQPSTAWNVMLKL